MRSIKISPQARTEQPTVIENAYHKTLAVVSHSSKLNRIIVYFRGSNLLVHKFVDFQFPKMKVNECPKCWVHGAYYKGYKSLRGRVEPEVLKLVDLHPNTRVLVMGHGVGGAMAVIQAMKLKQQGINCQLITLVSPRVGNTEFASYINKLLGDFWRVVFRTQSIAKLSRIQARWNRDQFLQ